MLDPDEKLYELLLTEKNLADSQIGGYGDLSLKVLTFFGGAVAVLGWLYSEKGFNGLHEPIIAGAICAAVVIIGCGVILQGITTYGFTLGYIQYKHETLNEAFVRVARMNRYPFNHIRAWWHGAARRPVLLASGGFVALHALLSVALTVVSACHFINAHAPVFLLLTLVSALVLAFTLYVEYRLYKALEQIFRMHLSFPPGASEKYDISQAG